MARPREWTKAEDDLIRVIVSGTEVLSANAIIKRTGMKRSRSALIAYCGRNGIKLMHKPTRPSKVKTPPAPYKAYVSTNAVLEPAAHNISLLRANDSHCRHFESRKDERGHQIICGAPATRGSYCAEHGHKYYMDEDTVKRMRATMRKTLYILGRK
jgi:hypothetical protein